MAGKIFQKKAQGLPLNTIVIAVLVVTVLLFIVLFFSQGMLDFREGTGEAKECGPDNPSLEPMYGDKAPEDFKNLEDEDGAESCSELGSDSENYTGTPVSGCCVRE